MNGYLDLSSYSGVVAGGASGKAVVAGKPEDSPLYTFPAHLEDPKMPPNAPKIPQREIDTLRRWVEGGLIEKSGDPEPPTALAGSETSVETLVAPEIPTHAGAISALAVSPVDPIAAVSGHHQIFLFDLATRRLLGALKFPEGDVFQLTFSKNGQTLPAAGGIGAESGMAVLFWTKTWAHVSSLGDEIDSILAADLSLDETRVVIGGPNRAVKIVANPNGEVLQTLRKPTDRVTSTCFSPDRLLVAAGDRFGGLFLWQTRSGRDFLALGGHFKAITAIAWINDGDELLSGGEDGSIQILDINNGKMRHRWEAHPGGVLSIDVHPSGQIASSGRDRRIRIWQPSGKLVSDFGPTPHPTTRVAWMAEGRSVVSGDLSGELRVWNLTDSESTALPMPRTARPAVVGLVSILSNESQVVLKPPPDRLAKHADA